MSEQREYQAPLVEPEKKIGRIWKDIKGSIEVLAHGLVPHQRAKLPQKSFNKTHITTDDDFLYQTAFEMYKESSQRIDGLEEKGFKLLTYISAVSAILIYFLSQDITGMYKFVVILSLFLLVVAIIISLRCIGVKSQKVIFLDAIFVFDPTAEPETKDKKSVIAEILNCAVFNQTVADNTADILRASRIMLSLGIITTVISCVFFLKDGVKKDNTKIYQADVSFKDSTFIKSLGNTNIRQDKINNDISKEILILRKNLDSLKFLLSHPPQIKHSDSK